MQYEQILPLSQTTTRGHSKKLYKKNCRTNVRKYSFSQRVVDEWNKIPKKVINSKTINTLFISSIHVDPGPRNRGPTSLLALKIRTPVANTGKLRSIGQVPVIRIRKSKKGRQHNDQKKKDKMINNDLQNIQIKLKIE